MSRGRRRSLQWCLVFKQLNTDLNVPNCHLGHCFRNVNGSSSLYRSIWKVMTTSFQRPFAKTPPPWHQWLSKSYPVPDKQSLSCLVSSAHQWQINDKLYSLHHAVNGMNKGRQNDIVKREGLTVRTWTLGKIYTEGAEIKSGIWQTIFLRVKEGWADNGAEDKIVNDDKYR